LKVLKFGGTSVANAKNVKKVVEILKSESNTHNLAVVVSAFGGITDKLLEAGTLANSNDKAYLKAFEAVYERHLNIANELVKGHQKDTLVQAVETKLNELKNYLDGVFLLGEFSNRSEAIVLGFGEQLSSYIIYETLKEKVPETVLKDSRELIITNNSFTNARVHRKLTHERLSDFFNSVKAKITILPGFISKSKTGDYTTLGRGGSDYTAAIIASAVKASVLEIWTDVSGMYTANPKLVRQAYPIDQISYEEAMELSHFGAKVLYPPTVQPALQNQIPIHIKNTFEPNAKGTLISQSHSSQNGLITGISHVDGIALLTLEGGGMVGVTGFASRLFSALSKAEINVVVITQASSEHSISVGIYSDEAELAKTVVDQEFSIEISLKRIKPLQVENDLAIVAVVGSAMKNHQGVSGKMFSALGQNNVNVRAIAQGSSELNISAVISKNDIKKALTTLHSRFFEKQIKTLHLFIVGIGNVGGILIEQIKQQQEYLKEHLRLNLKINGVSNSKQMVFDAEGLDLDHWKTRLAKGEPRTNDTFFQKVKALNLSNSIYLDITANEAVSKTYTSYLKESISVVACNKIASSSDYQSYRELKILSKAYGASFLFETNVGAGLPVINTLNNLVDSGDEIHSIQAVLSGSLNFIFNGFNDSNSFYDVVKQAQKEGYTEPDPRIDLSGADVARKILILARESGYKLNFEDIENQSFLPKSCMEANSVEGFYETLKTHAEHFEALYTSAQEKGQRLKYVAEFNKGKAKVGLKEVSPDHPFYNLEGKDNIVLFYTSRYPEQPMIIKGAGAGASVTASGLLADVISIGKK